MYSALLEIWLYSYKEEALIFAPSSPFALLAQHVPNAFRAKMVSPVAARAGPGEGNAALQRRGVGTRGLKG